MGRGRSSYAKEARSGGTKSARRTTRKALSTRGSITPCARITCTRSSTSSLAIISTGAIESATEPPQPQRLLKIAPLGFLFSLCGCGGSVANFDLYLLQIWLIQFGPQFLRFFDPLLEARILVGAQRPELIEIALGFGVAPLEQSGHAAIGVSQSVARVQFDGPVVIADRAFDIAFDKPRVTGVVPDGGDVGIDLDRLLEIGQGLLGVALGEPGVPAIEVGRRGFRIEFQRAVEIGHRALEILFAYTGQATIAPRRGQTGVDRDGLLGVGQRSVEIILLQQ